MPASVFKANMRCALHVTLMLVLAGFCAVWAKRGRVQVVDRQILTDKGTILRGCYFCVDITGDFPDRQDFHDMANVYGLNAVHCYLETFWQAEETPGMYDAQGDSVVKIAGEEGLYVVLTIGCGNRNGDSTLKGVKNFWSHYAARYKDETHVIYEIQNEPCHPMPYPDSTMHMEREAYQLIRAAAPQTHISLFSFIGLTAPQSALATIEAVDDIVDWSNASVAYHSYRPSDEALDSVSARYPCLNTEFWAGNTSHPNTGIIADHEERAIGWLSFINVKEIEQAFKQDINNAGIVWTPDFGDWPRSSATVIFGRQQHGRADIRETFAPHVQRITLCGRRLDGHDRAASSAGIFLLNNGDGVWRRAFESEGSPNH